MLFPLTGRGLENAKFAFGQMYSCLTTTDLAALSSELGGRVNTGICRMYLVADWVWLMEWGVDNGCEMEANEAVKDSGRKRIIGLRLTADEYGELEKSWKNSTVRKLSEFVRRVLFGKRITVYSRSKSLDELVEELVVLRRELHAIGVNFNQAVHRLNLTDHMAQRQIWAERFERDRDRFFALFEEVKLKINSVSGQWLQ